jgi:Domain of unknown function (DUF4166)/Saccharopine dehydrogenase NADP binding domain
VKTAIVIGGYGGFGARLSRGLLRDGWRIYVAGRRLEAATAFCQTIDGAIPLEADRLGDLAPLLLEIRPDIIIDAAGPFQGSDHRLPRTCIKVGIAYLDLADARAFVCGLSSLNQDAKAAGVTLVSGGSSVPALSGAVVRSLTGDMAKVTAIDIAISASNRATAGPSVSAAILSYVGRPISLWRGGRWRAFWGWDLLRDYRFSVTGRQALNRLTALSDVPDHSVIPNTHRDRPATVFRAGPEFRFQVLALWLLSHAVRWGWISSLSKMSGWLRYLQTPTNALGSDRSGMLVEVKGFVGDHGIVRRWTLIAEDGDGPEIPTLAARLLARMIVDKQLPVGAYDASSLLSLAQFSPLFEPLAIYHETVQSDYIPLYRRVMGADFDALPPIVKKMHNIVGNAGALGSARVTRGTSTIASLICAIMGFPPAGDSPLHVTFDEHLGRETWTRDFNGKCFKSILAQSGGKLTESFGPLTFKFNLTPENQSLNMHLLGWTAFGVTMPLWLAPTTKAREWADGDDFCFDVAIDLPFIGRVVRYEGRLKPV